MSIVNVVRYAQLSEYSMLSVSGTLFIVISKFKYGRISYVSVDDIFFGSCRLRKLDKSSFLEVHLQSDKDWACNY